MKTFYGIVEDRQDPLKVGRVRVRIHGIHTDDKQRIATPDLPWAQVLLPTTSAGLSGFGTQHGLVEGSTVFGFFRDGDLCQQPVIMGASSGIPQSGYKEGVESKQLTRTVDKGFNDPRRLTTSTYKGTSDGPNPSQASTRGFGLTTALDTAPKIYESREYKYDGTGSTITEPTLTTDDLPYYPLYTDKSDLSSFATGTGTYTDRDTTSAKGIPSKAKPVYPYNKVIQSESGHVIEIDDTLGVERLAIEHRSGTFHEIHPDGSQVTRIVNDNYTAILKDDELWVGGNVNITIGGDATVAIGKDATVSVGGNLKADVTGTTDITSIKNLSIIAPEISLTGTVVKLNS